MMNKGKIVFKVKIRLRMMTQNGYVHHAQNVPLLIFNLSS